MLVSTLAFESMRKAGQIPQMAIIAHLPTGDVVFCRDGVTVSDGLVWYRANGERLANGTTLAGPMGEVVYRGVLTIGAISEGDEGAGLVTVLPSRRGTVTVDLANATGEISDLLLTMPLVGSDIDVIVTFPGLAVADRLVRFRGECQRVSLDDERCALELVSP
jgi:hypothetical protein